MFLKPPHHLYDQINSQRLAEIHALYQELAPLTHTKLDYQNNSARDGSAYVYFYHTFSDKVSLEDVINHYDQELKSKGWIFKEFHPGHKYLGLWKTEDTKFKSFRYVKQDGNYRASIGYKEGVPKKFTLYFTNTTLW
jgi:hypothetical protein